MTDSKWGKRHTCFKCDTKFYDLNKEKAICPQCEADQAKAPTKTAVRRQPRAMVPAKEDSDEAEENSTKQADDDDDDDADEDDTEAS